MRGGQKTPKYRLCYGGEKNLDFRPKTCHRPWVFHLGA